MKGWVYIIVSESMPNLLKVGYTMKSPDIRAARLGNTGNPCKYQVVYEIFLFKPKEVEKKAHKLLKKMDVWVNKEWFDCSINLARRTILCAAGLGIFHQDVRVDIRRNEAKSKWLKNVLDEVLLLMDIDDKKIVEHDDDGSLYVDEGFLYLNC